MLSPMLTKLFPYTYGKTLINFHNKFFSIYNYLFRFFFFIRFSMSIFANNLFALVGPSGLEPPTSCLSGTRSNLLSYEPLWLVCDSHTWTMILGTFVPWWRWWDSNPWPPACRAGALPAELHPHINGLCFFSTVFVFKNREYSFYTLCPCVSIELSSRTVARKVFSPLQSLTSVFGMGTGVPSAFVTLTFFSMSFPQWILNKMRSLTSNKPIFEIRKSSFEGSALSP